MRVVRCAIMCLSLLHVVVRADTLVTKSGRRFPDCQIRRVVNGKVLIKYGKSGVAMVPLDDLPDDIRSKLEPAAPQKETTLAGQPGATDVPAPAAAEQGTEGTARSQEAGETEVRAELPGELLGFPIPASTDKLPGAFRGYELAPLIASIKAGVAKAIPDEDRPFLSAKAIQERTQAVVDAHVPEGQFLCFGCRPLIEDDYDAEKQVFVVESWDLSVSRKRKSKSRAFDYMGTTALGVTMEIRKSYSEYDNVEIDRFGLPGPTGKYRDFPNPVFRIPAAPEDAKSLVGRLLIYILCRPNSQGITRGEVFHGKPTIGDPFEIVLTYNVLHVDLIEAWLVDRQTGEVLMKKRP
jgi:hypothetical protein